MVLEGSGHDSYNDAVQLVAVHYPRAVAYLRSFKPVHTDIFASMCLECVCVAALGAEV